MELVTLIIMGVIAAGMVVYALMPNRAERAEAIKRRSAGLAPDDDITALQSKAKGRATGKSMFDKAAPLLSRPVMPKNEAEQSTLRGKLASAGLRRESAVSVFLASKTVGGLGLAFVGFLYGSAAAKDVQQMIYYVIFGLGIGVLMPNLWLSSRIRKRAEAIRNGLPDSLDLMVVGVEAGLGLDAALLRVSDEMKHVHPALAEEFQISSIETQMGTPRGEALTKMADRSAVQEMRGLVAVIVQAEKLGTSIAKALRMQAESLRTKRRQRAEERAQKTAVKLLIPLILFIFPAIFVVLAGPAAIHLMHTFGGQGLKR
jgi:tight adherence protein C